MPAGGQPVPRMSLELVLGHPGVGEGSDLEQPLLAEFRDRRHVAFEIGLEGLALLEARIGVGERLQPVAAEEELHLQRLLAPQGAVIVEGGDALRRRHKIRSARRRHARNEIEDG